MTISLYLSINAFIIRGHDDPRGQHECKTWLPNLLFSVYYILKLRACMTKFSLEQVGKMKAMKQ